MTRACVLPEVDLIALDLLNPGSDQPPDGRPTEQRIVPLPTALVHTPIAQLAQQLLQTPLRCVVILAGPSPAKPIGLVTAEDLAKLLAQGLNTVEEAQLRSQTWLRRPVCCVAGTSPTAIGVNAAAAQLDPVLVPVPVLVVDAAGYFQGALSPEPAEAGDPAPSTDPASACTLPDQSSSSFAQTLTQQQAQFIELAAHELRTPLAVIASSAGILKDFGHRLSLDKTRKHLERIQTYIQHTTQLLDNCLIVDDASQVHRGFHPEPVNPVLLCESIVQDVQMGHDSHPLVFHATGAALNQPLLLDTQLIRQVLIHLLLNAIRFSPPPRAVHCHLQQEVDHWRLQITDEGIGIPAADQRRIFLPFQRGSNVGDFAGLGLGLTIVQKCTQRHGGVLQLQSQLHQGTTVTVQFPA